MKIRVGFVSNSSSSSYIIAVRKSGQCCERCGRADLDFLGLFADLDGDSQIQARGLSDVLENFREHILDCDYNPDKEWANEVKCRDCGGAPTTRVERQDGQWQVECDTCKACGPAAKTEQKAEEAWKRVNGNVELDEEERELLTTQQTLKTKGAELTDKGYEVAKVNISYHDAALQAILEEGKKNGSIVMLRDYGY